MGEVGEERRQAPQKSMLREAFRRGWPSVGDWVPKRVRREAEAYVRCGDARSGFVEVSCDDCHQSRVVAFCCKGRGWCPSCTNRRAVETRVRLAALLPWVRHRQWTLSLPFKLRFLVVKRPELLKRLKAAAGAGGVAVAASRRPTAGSVGPLGRWGGRLHAVVRLQPSSHSSSSRAGGRGAVDADRRVGGAARARHRRRRGHSGAGTAGGPEGLRGPGGSVA